MDNQHHGKYRIVEKIAKGGMGEVFKAYDPDIERYVAIKILRLGILSDPNVRHQCTERFLWEARIAGRLSHANIVPVYESGTRDSTPYIVMEYIEYTVNDLLKQGRTFSEDEIYVMMSQCCEALGHAHKTSVLHRDMKPSNILVDSQSLSIKLTDFGIAKVPEMDGLTQTGQFIGTPGYTAPEQLKDVEVDGRADLFSLGIILYELISGQKPFHGSNISAIIAKLLNDDPQFDMEVFKTPPFDTWLPMLQKALKKDPVERFQTVHEFKAALNSAHQPVFSDGSANIPFSDLSTRIESERPGRDDAAPGPSGGYRSRKIWMVLCVLIVMGAAAYLGRDFLVQDAPRTQADLYRVSHDGKVKLTGEVQPVFHFGDGLNLTVTPSEERYIYLLYLDSERNVMLLFPSNFSPDVTNPLLKGKTYHFPTSETSYTLGGASGKEEIHVIGYKGPFKLIEPYAKDLAPIISWSVLQTILKQVENDREKEMNYYTTFKYELVP